MHRQQQYIKIWQQLKRDDTVTVLIPHSSMVQRVKTGVILAKNRDLGFKVMNEVEPLRLKISYNEETQRLTFRLVQRLGMVEKVVV
jgi:hypothetical protein